MLAVRVRSGLEETSHDGAVAVSEPDGTLVAWSGEIDRPFYLRSSAKPFQAFASQEAGASLEAIELAVASASHRGHPVQIALVESILGRVGLDESDLGCPPDWPISDHAHDRLIRQGEAKPRRIWHNCSGKHAGFLTACVAKDWPIDTYLSPDHPLQRRIVEYVSEWGEYAVEPVGVDGCGAPVLRTTTQAMSLLFSRLATYPELSEVFGAMHRYPALVAGNGAGDTAIAVATNSVAKGGALGCIGVGLRSGLGLAVKSWDGLNQMADLAAIATMGVLGALPPPAASHLRKWAQPPQLGGGEPQGVAESRLELRFT